MHTLNHTEVSGEFANVVDGAQTRVFIISSVCGGTGTGMFLDIAFLVNHLFAGTITTPFDSECCFFPPRFASSAKARNTRTWKRTDTRRCRN